jgi:autotransporter translocation and assembly factor TamB
MINNLKISGLMINFKNKNPSTPFNYPWWLPHHFQFSNITLQPILYNTISVPASQWSTQFYIAQNKLKIQTFQGELADNTNIAHINLSFIKIFKAQWDIQLNNLARLLSNSTGKLVSTGVITDQKVNISIDLQHLHYKTTDIERFKLALQGLLKNQQLELTLSPKDFIFQSTTLNSWTLSHSAQLQFSENIASLTATKFQGQHGFFVVSGSWQKNKSWNLNESGQAFLEKYGINPTFNISEQGSAYKINYGGTIQSSKGFLNIHGFTKNHSTQLNITGHDFLAVNTKIYQAWISPDLTLKNNQQGWDLSGKLFIPKANITIPDENTQVITLPDDVVFVDQKIQPARLPLYSNIQLILGENITIAAQGLTGKINGAIMLHDTPQQLTMGNGRLNIINGLYKIYGQTLKIQYGNLIFNNSPVTDPGLNIRATKKITVSNSSGATSLSTLSSTLNNLSGPLMVGADVTGTLEKPQVQLFSIPATLSQLDILSYLALGHSAAQASPLDAQLLLQATLPLQSGGGVVEQLRRELQTTFGIDKINIESINYIDPTSQTPTLNQTTALVLEKALSPRLYISYSAGLMGTVNIFTLKYKLTDKWFLQSTGSTFGSGADIFVAW